MLLLSGIERKQSQHPKLDATTQNLDCNKTVNQFGVERTSFGVGMNVKELTHSQQQPQAPKLTERSQQSNKQSDQCSVPVPLKCLSFTGLRTQLESSARHTLSN